MGIIKLTNLPMLEKYSADCVLIVLQNGQLYRIDPQIMPDLMLSSSLDDTLTDSEKAANAKVVGDILNKIHQDVEDLKYSPVEILEFYTADDNGTKTNRYLRGHTADRVNIFWQTSKTPAKILLNDIEVDPSSVSLTDTRGYTQDQRFRLVVTDERGAQATKDIWIYFLNYVRYGAAAYEGVDSDFVLPNLTKQMAQGRSGTYRVNAGDGERIWFAFPTRMGNPTFTVGGFSGGFSLVKTLDIQNDAGYTESYDVWISEQEALGDTTVVVS